MPPGLELVRAYGLASALIDGADGDIFALSANAWAMNIVARNTRATRAIAGKDPNRPGFAILRPPRVARRDAAANSKAVGVGECRRSWYRSRSKKETPQAESTPATESPQCRYFSGRQ